MRSTIVRPTRHRGSHHFMEGEMIDLSWRRKRNIIENLGSVSQVDEELLQQCAYYPRPPAFSKPSPCLSCSFTSPNPRCKRGHILTLTPLKEEVKRPSHIQLSSVIRGLSPEDVEALLHFIHDRGQEQGKKEVTR